MTDEPAEATFQPYLDAVTKSGDRTRNVWYILVLVLIAVFFGEWNTRGDSVSTTRFVRMMDALVCVHDKSWRPQKGGPSCADGLEYAIARHHFPYALTMADGPSEETRTEIGKVLEKRVEDLMRRELETHVITVPILGVSIDGNDFWLVSSFVMIFLLRVLRACLNRELDNLRRATMQATNLVKRELILMSQLFAVPSDRRHLHLIMLFLPLALYGFELYNTYDTIDVGNILHGNLVNKFLTCFEIILALPIGYYCYRCFEVAKQIETQLTHLEGPMPGAAVKFDKKPPAT
jgi:hypothetical protein